MGCLRLDILDEHYYNREAFKKYERSEYIIAENRRTGATVSEANVIFSAKTFFCFVFFSHKKNEEETGYDAWGRRYRFEGTGMWPPNYFYFDDHAPFTVYPSPEEILDFFTRGFTGHEHLDFFGLINMNGRMYDPVIARFLSPDPFVQAPTFSQSYNRYSYVFNNPLRFKDPSGYWGEDAWYGWNWATGRSGDIGGYQERGGDGPDQHVLERILSFGWMNARFGSGGRIGPGIGGRGPGNFAGSSGAWFASQFPFSASGAWGPGSVASFSGDGLRAFFGGLFGLSKTVVNRGFPHIPPIGKYSCVFVCGEVASGGQVSQDDLSRGLGIDPNMEAPVDIPAWALWSELTGRKQIPPEKAINRQGLFTEFQKGVDISVSVPPIIEGAEHHSVLLNKATMRTVTLFGIPFTWYRFRVMSPGEGRYVWYSGSSLIGINHFFLNY